MVLDDVFHDPSKSEKPQVKPEERSLESQLASPIDRLASTVADFVLFLPIMALVIAPFRRQAMEAQVAGVENAWSAAVLSAALVGFAALVVFQAVFIAWLGATPGKYVMGLRVVSVWTRSTPRVLDAFIRAFVWCLEILLCGVPWLAIFANERRRPFHDRISDCAVIALDPKKRAGPPTVGEVSVASGFQSAALSVLVLILTVNLIDLYSVGDSAASVARSLEDQGVLCTDVRETREAWIRSIGKSATLPSRLDVALSLYAADELSEECLKSEADFALWRSENKATAYLAKAFVEASDETLFGSYLAKTCEADFKSDACKVTYFVLPFDGDDAEVIDETLTEAKSESEVEAKQAKVVAEGDIASILASLEPQSQLYLKAWAVRYLMEQKQYVRALEIMDFVAPQARVGAFFSRERARAQWMRGQKEAARLATKTTIELVDPSTRMEMARWLCWHDSVDEGCSETARSSCSQVISTVESSSKWLAKAEVAAAYIRGASCAGAKGVLDQKGLEEIRETVANPEAKAYLKAIAQIQDSEEKARKEGLATLKHIASGDKGLGAFFVEANLKLAELADSASELESIQERWNEADPTQEGWRHLGERLMLRLNALHAWDKAIEVGLKLTELDSSDPRLYRPMVVAAYRSGNLRMALGFLKSLSDNEPAELARAPASVDGFDEAIREIRNHSKGAP